MVFCTIKFASRTAWHWVWPSGRLAVLRCTEELRKTKSEHGGPPMMTPPGAKRKPMPSNSKKPAFAVTSWAFPATFMSKTAARFPWATHVPPTRPLAPYMSTQSKSRCPRHART